MITKKAPKTFRNEVPHRVIRIIEVLRSMGHKAYVVGGAVRDMYLGETPKDWDVATSATGEEISSLRLRSEHPFQIRRVGRSFPVFLIGCVEVATFRYEVLQRPVGLVDLALDGNDIMGILGIEPGPKVGEIKNRLMEMVLDDPDLNNRNTLIAYLESIKT